LHQIDIMKVFSTILIFIAVALIIFNLTLLDFDQPFEGNSLVALIGIIASFCAVFILLIFRMSKKIEEKLKN
jgi:hypothetical protein